MTSQSSRRRSRSGLRLPLWAVGLLVLVGIIFLIVTSVWLFRTVVGLTSDAEVSNPNFDLTVDPTAQAASDVSDQTSVLPLENQPFISTGALQRWSGRDRVTMLVLGIDQRCDEEGPTRTDTMMVLTMDPIGLSAAVLSLPRDLWVQIPGFGVDKINQAHFMGEIYDYPGGGPALAVETVEATLGVNIDFYATVNFDAFVEGVDQIGGIDIVVPEDIADDSYPDNCYGYDPFYLKAGEHHLDGQSALKYARTRATFGGDIDRAERQQQVIVAVRDKVARLDMVPQLLARAPELWRIFRDNVNTNLNLNDALQLALLAQEIPSESVRSEVIDFDYVYSETTPDGQQVLIPIRDNIRVLRDQIFAPPMVPTPVIENLPELTLEEEARVAIYNGSQRFGLAAETRDYLVDYDINVIEIGNADSSEYRTTQVIDYGTHQNTTHYLTQLMNIPPLNISSSNKPAGDFDVLVILGGDWSVPGSE